MQDIRKPYSHSKSNNLQNKREDISSRLEKFEKKILEDEKVSIKEKSVIRKKINNVYEDEDKEASYNRQSKTVRNKKISSGTFFFTIFMIVVISGFLLLSFVFNSATIIVTPKHKDIELSELSSKIMVMNLEGLEGIRFKVATSSISKNRTLPKTETKTVQAKASGKITIYNNFDENPQKLIKNTRFESSQGKIYRINETITVPGMKGETLGSISVTVYADSYGSDYNIPPSEFTIPGFKDSTRYKGFFAKSNESMTGGASGVKGLVSKSDLNAVKDEFAMSITKELEEVLGKFSLDGYIPVYDQIQIIFTDNEKNINIGDTSEYIQTGVGYLMLVNKDELANSIASKTNTVNKKDGEKMHLLYDDTIQFTLRSTADLSKDGELEVMVEGNPRLFWDIDENSLKELVLGKTQVEFNEIIRSFPGIGKVTTNFFPFWIKTFSTKIDSINIVQNMPLR